MRIVTTSRAATALVGVLALGLAACGSGAPPPTTVASATTLAASTTAAGSTDTSAAAVETTAPPASDKPAGIKEGADTILTPAPSGEADSAVWAVYRETSTIDPLYVFDYPDNAAMTVACESLLRQNPDLTIGPGLATSVEFTSPTALVVTLRDGVTFSDGKPMTTDDVVFSLKRQQDPANGGFYSATFSNVTDIAATGPMEVTLTMTKQDMLLREELSGPIGTIVEKAYVESKGADFGTAKGGTMCTGAFSLTSWVTGEGLTFTRYDGYWDKSLPRKLKQIIIKGVSDEAVATSGLLTGEIDGTYPLVISTLDQLRSSDKVTVSEGPGYGINAFIVSNFDGALKDKRVRQAISMAIDRPALITALFKGAASPARAVGVPGTWGYAKDVFMKGWNALPDVSKPDLDAAKKLVEAAGATGQTVRLGMSSELGSLAVQAGEFKRAIEAIGMKADLVSVSAANYINFFIDAKARETVDGFFTTNYPNEADPLGLYISMIGPAGSQAYNGYADPKAQALLEAARTEPDDNKRAQLVVDLQAMITDEMLWVPIVAPTNLLIMNKKITGAQSTFSYMFGPWAAYLGAT